MWNCHCLPLSRIIVAIPISSVVMTDSLTISAGEILLAALLLMREGACSLMTMRLSMSMASATP